MAFWIAVLLAIILFKKPPAGIPSSRVGNGFLIAGIVVCVVWLLADSGAFDKSDEYPEAVTTVSAPIQSSPPKLTENKLDEMGYEVSLKCAVIAANFSTCPVSLENRLKFEAVVERHVILGNQFAQQAGYSKERYSDDYVQKMRTTRSRSCPDMFKEWSGAMRECAQYVSDENINNTQSH